MTTLLTVSVVIPCFNHGEFLSQAVTSVTDIKRNDIEIIVVDDGSTDDRTNREMRILIDKGINVIRQENKGLAAARNAGISVSKGRYILPLDADNRLRPGYVEHGVRVLEANPRVGVVYGDAEYIGAGTGLWHVGPFERDRLLNSNFIDACAIYRRLLWEQNGGYDGTMPVQGEEDWDFWLSTLEHGWEFAYVPEVLFEYRITSGSMVARTLGFRKELDRFVAAKHGALYRDTCLQLLQERASIRVTCRNLYKLIKRNMRRKSSKRGRGPRMNGPGHPPSREETSAVRGDVELLRRRD
jgi:glycosyltransferase involved in cell wall biosynthesis